MRPRTRQNSLGEVGWPTPSHREGKQGGEGGLVKRKRTTWAVREGVEGTVLTSPCHLRADRETGMNHSLCTQRSHQHSHGCHAIQDTRRD